MQSKISMMKNDRRVLIVVFSFFGFLRISDAILCYSCADSTDNEEYAECTYKLDRLRDGRMKHEEDPAQYPIEDFPFIKNCSDYVVNGTEKYSYCVIEQIESFGTVNAFIRDCSNKTFSPLNVSSLKYVKPDNQSICGYSHLQLATICVRLCTGDFCNGPSSAINTVASVLPIFVAAFVMTALVTMRETMQYR